MRILITRPQELAQPLAQRLKKLGHKVILDPLLTVTPLSVNLPPLSAFQALIATSQQAIQCLATLTRQRDFPLWCVGEASAHVARSLGFCSVYEAEGTAKDLVEKVANAFPAPSLPLLHISGDVIRMDVVSALRRQGIPAQRLVIYRTEEAEALSLQTREALKNRELDAALFYSPRTARVFQRLCKAAHLDQGCATVKAVCLSASIKAALQELPWKTIGVAKKTTTDDLLLALMMAD